MSSLEDRTSSEEKRPVDGEQEQILTPEVLKNAANRRTSLVSKEGTVVNASGHRDQLQRQYGLLSICGLALTIDNAWIAFGGSLAVAVLNGGPRVSCTSSSRPAPTMHSSARPLLSSLHQCRQVEESITGHPLRQVPDGDG